jgi:2-amino-4-hydroxy-6-hydroxymethyldihydropteridine diphosphokinase
MARAYVGLGSNQADPLDQVRRALFELDQLPRTRRAAHSPLYRSAPVGPADQPDFINAVAALDTELDADALLSELQAIELAHARVRVRHWGPRTLDLDLLLYDDLRRNDPRLTLPHPHLHERVFVLRPLYTIAPDLHIPGHGSVAELLSTCPPLDIEQLTD